MRLRFPASSPALLALAGVEAGPDVGTATFEVCLTAARLSTLSVAAGGLEEKRQDRGRLTSPAGLGPRAEAAALAALLKALDAASAAPSASKADEDGLVALRAAACAAAAAAAPRPRLAQTPTSPAEAGLAAWAASAGISTAVAPAFFASTSCAANSPPLRGAAATRPIAPGEAIMSLPLASIITPHSVALTPLGAALAALPGLSPELALIAWTMVDSVDPASPYAPVWAALKAAPLTTGLGVGGAAAALLAGTPLEARLVAARAHVRAVFDASASLWTALEATVADPSDLCVDAYLWAVQVWYAFAMEVEVPAAANPPPPPGSSPGQAAAPAATTPALAPLAFLLNHSARPHAVRYGGLEAGEDGGGLVMRVRACAPAGPGEEVTLSYGPKTNADLLLFYGFALALADNPDDALEVVVVGDGGEGEAGEGAAARARAAAAAGLPDFPHTSLAALDYCAHGWPGHPTGRTPFLASTRLASASPGELAAITAGEACAWSGAGLSAATVAAAARLGVRVAMDAAKGLEAAAERARAFEAATPGDQAWVQSALVYCEGGARLAHRAAGEPPLLPSWPVQRLRGVR